MNTKFFLALGAKGRLEFKLDFLPLTDVHYAG